MEAEYQAKMQDIVDNSTNLNENFSPGGWHGYTNNAFPSIEGAKMEVYSVTYYDSYGYINRNEFDGRYRFRENEVKFLYDLEKNVKEQVTTTKAKLIKQPGMVGIEDLRDWIISVNYYDINGNLIQSVSDNHTGGIDIVSNEVNFTGELLMQKENHFNILAVGLSNYSIHHSYKHNHSGAVVEEMHQINDEEPIRLLKQSYDDLSRIKRKKIHKKANNVNSVQEALFKYNIRSWLTDINDVQNLSSNLFAMNLKYNDAVNPQFNGNIGSMEYSYAFNRTYGKYDFSYDGLNRLIQSDYEGTGDYSTQYLYDANGNITSLVRHGFNGGSGSESDYSTIDQLTYTYDGNQLRKVDDLFTTICQENGFSDKGIFESTEYIYDANGNMISDMHKQITAITYNHLNLPARIDMITKDNYSTIYYLYDAAGNKLRKQTESDGALIGTTDYMGNFVYTDNELDFIHTSEGRVLPDMTNSEEFEYQYFLKDHLGDNRVLFNETGIILQADSYYPFGMHMEGLFEGLNKDGLLNKYLYNGKELQDDFELDWYDYGARFYDAQLGRWHVVEPLAEKYSDWSPYNYVANNPLIFIDPNGLEKYKFKVSGKVSTGKIGAQGKIEGVGIGGNYSLGGGEIEVSIYLSFDTDKRLPGIGISYTNRLVEEGSYSASIGPFSGGEKSEKETTLDLNTTDGFSFKSDKKFKTTQSGSFYFFSTEESQGKDTKTIFGTNAEVNALLIGTGLDIELEVSNPNKKRNRESANDSKDDMNTATNNNNIQKKEKEL